MSKFDKKGRKGVAVSGDLLGFRYMQPNPATTVSATSSPLPFNIPSNRKEKRSQGYSKGINTTQYLQSK